MIGCLPLLLSLSRSSLGKIYNNKKHYIISHLIRKSKIQIFFKSEHQEQVKEKVTEQEDEDKVKF